MQPYMIVATQGEKIVLQSNDNSFIVEVASCSKRTNDCMVSNHLYSIHFLFIYFSDSSTLPSARGKSNEGLRVSTTGYKLDYVCTGNHKIVHLSMIIRFITTFIQGRG